MAEVKINYDTGDIALPQQGGGYRIYKKGEYRFNQQTNQFATPADQGGWDVHDAPAGAVKQSGILPMSELPTGEYQFDINAGIPGMAVSGFTALGDIMSGKLKAGDPDYEKRVADTSALMSLGPGLLSRPRMTVPLRGDVRGTPKPPTAEQLLSAGDAGYKAARAQGVDFSPPAVQSMVDDLLSRFQDEGFIAENHPAVANALNRVRNAPEVPDGDVFVNFNQLVGVREALKDAAADFNHPTDQRWATLGINAIDDFLENPPAAAVPAGQDVSRAASAGRQFAEANENYGAGKRSNLLTGKEKRAGNNAAKTNSGLNLDNQLRQRIDEIIARPKEGRGFTKEELAFLDSIVNGTFGENASRYVGNLLGGGGGLGAALTGILTGQATGQVGLGTAIGLAVPTAGYIGKKVSAGLTGRRIALVDALTRKRSPLYRKKEAEAPMVPSGDARREALIKALIQYDSAQPWLQEQPQPMQSGGVI